MGILTDGLYLLGCLDTILYLPQPVEIGRLFLSHLPLQRSHLLVLGHGHGFCRSLQRLSRSLKLRTYP